MSKRIAIHIEISGAVELSEEAIAAFCRDVYGSISARSEYEYEGRKRSALDVFTVTMDDEDPDPWI